MGFVGPFYSLYFSKITQNLKDVGLIIGLYWVFVGLLEIPCGYLADRLGKNKAFMLGGGLSSIVVMLYPFVSDLKLLALLEIIGAFAYALQWPAFYSLLAEATTKKNRTKEIAIIGSVENVFYGISIIIAGILISIFGFSLLFTLSSFLNLGSSLLIGKKFS
jgi:MFS family permease